MAVHSLYFSPTGGTAKVAEALVSVWEEDVEKVDLILEDIGGTQFSEKDIVYVSVPVFGGRIPTVCVSMAEKISGNGARAVCTVVYGNRAYDDALMELKNTLEKSGFVCVAAVAAVAKHSMFENVAVGRPDEEDLKQLGDFAQRIKGVLDSGVCDESVKVPGNFPYKRFNGVPIKPKVNKNCTKNGICANECPVGAIPANDPSKLDESQCITCMHCVTVCPNNARSINKLIVKAAGMSMKKQLEIRKENELFI